MDGSGKRTDCTECGNSLTAENIFCSQCGSRQKGECPPPCGNFLSRTDRFCSKCGKEVEAALFRTAPTTSGHGFDRHNVVRQQHLGGTLQSTETPHRRATSLNESLEAAHEGNDSQDPDMQSPWDPAQQQGATAMETGLSNFLDSEHAVEVTRSVQDLVQRHVPGHLVPTQSNTVNQSTNVFNQNINVQIKSKGNLCMGPQDVIQLNKDDGEENNTKCKLNFPKQHLMIEKTTKMIREQICKTSFVPTKAFAIAKQKIEQNNVVVLKGNSGDGKTCLAYHLLAWLGQISRENKHGAFEVKKLLQLHDITSIDETVGPDLGLAVLFDDMFTNLKDFEKWQRREHSVQACIARSVYNDKRANCLIVVIRNDIYNEYVSKLSKDGIFNTENILDLSSPEYFDEQDRRNILGAYLPRGTFNFTDEEKKIIVQSSPNIGFPQCCRMYRDVPELQYLKVQFFKNPSEFMKTTIRDKIDSSKRSALLYLFLMGGRVCEASLDPYGKESKKCLKAAFEIDLSSENVEIPISDFKKLSVVHGALQILTSSLVATEKEVLWENDSPVEVIYFTFAHDSIKDAVAMLYGSKTTIGFILNCHTNALCYLSFLREPGINKLTITHDNWHICKRLLQELESKNCERYRLTAALNLWHEKQFLLQFFSWLKEKQEDQNVYYRWTVKDQLFGPVQDFTFIVYSALVGNLPLLRHLLTEMKVNQQEKQLKNAVDAACVGGSVECVVHILSRGVLPDSQSVFYCIEGGKCDILKKLLSFKDIIHAKRDMSRSFVRSQDVNILQEACLLDKTALAIYIVSQYPYLAYETDGNDQTIFHHIALKGNCDLFKQMSEITLKTKSQRERQFYLEQLRGRRNMNLLQASFMFGNKEMSLFLCDKYPGLLHHVDNIGLHTLHYAAKASGDVSWYKQIEKQVLEKTQYEEREKYIENIVSQNGHTVLHESIRYYHKALSLHLCRQFPGLIAKRDESWHHSLHYIAIHTGDVKWFKEIESIALKRLPGKQHYLERLLLDDERGAETVLHLSCSHKFQELSVYLCERYPDLIPKQTGLGCTFLYYVVDSGDLEWYKRVERHVIEFENSKGKPGWVRNMKTLSGESILDVAKEKDTGEGGFWQHLEQTLPQYIDGIQ